MLGIGYVHLKQLNIDTSPSSIWSRGFQVSGALLVTDDVWLPENPPSEILLKILMANGFQLVLSFFYLFYNNILTRQLVADKWSRFLQPTGEKALRVSWPVGMQRSSYMLSLPLSYSIPLMIAMMAPHSLISQSIFLV